MIHSGLSGTYRAEGSRERAPSSLRESGDSGQRGGDVVHSVFRYDLAGRLGADGVAIEDALVQAGAGTPAYVYSSDAVEARFLGFRDALRGALRREDPLAADPLVAVAVKANAQPALLARLAGRGAGAEVVSAAERLVADGVGFPPDRVVLSGVGKTVGDVDTALRLGVRFVSVESAPELDLLDARARRLGVRASAALRLNPGLEPYTHPKLATGAAETKFGIGADEIIRIVESRESWPAVDIIGAHSHLGSQIDGLAGLEANARGVGEVFGGLARSGVPLRLVDLGGGLGIPQQDAEPETSFEEYAAAVVGALREAAGGLPFELVAEPGRALFGPAGVLVTRVLHLKRSGGREFVVVDSGMNDFLRPAMYDAHHRILPLRRREGEARRFDVVGGVCETGDFFARDRPLAPPEPGDLLAVLDAGAYGYSLASNINLRPRPAEVVVEGGRAHLARPAETPEQLADEVLGRTMAPTGESLR